MRRRTDVSCQSSRVLGKKPNVWTFSFNLKCPNMSIYANMPKWPVGGNESDVEQPCSILEANQCQRSKCCLSPVVPVRKIHAKEQRSIEVLEWERYAFETRWRSIMHGLYAKRIKE